MAIIRLYMTMSLDGFITGPRDSVDAPMGIGGFRLFNWLDRRNDPGPSGQVFTEAMSTRAVIAGRRTYELARRRAASATSPMCANAPRGPARRPGTVT